MLEIYVAFLKKSSAKNFPTGKAFSRVFKKLRSTAVSTKFAQTKAVKFSPAFFKRRRGQGREALGALRRERNTPMLQIAQER